MRRVLSILCVVVPMALAGCATSYSARPINASVSDADTGEPLEGVIVVAHWVLSYGWEGGGARDLVTMEAVTDSSGAFHFPAWGPVPIPSGMPLNTRLHYEAPRMIFYKPGYWSHDVTNVLITAQPGPGPSVRTSDYDGKVIKLRKFDGTQEVYIKELEYLLNGVNYGGCNFKKLPHVLSVLTKAQQQYEHARIYTNILSVERLQQLTDGKCGSVGEFLEHIDLHRGR